MLDKTLAVELARQATATLAEVLLEGGGGIVDAGLRPLAVPCRAAGPGFTVSLPAGDNLSIHHAIARASAGALLVVKCADDGRHGFWGEIATVAAMARGIIGLITDGAVRDTDAIRSLNFPVFCRGTQIRGTVKKQRGTLGEPVEIGGAMIRTGDFVVADSDGIVVVRPGAMEATLRAALAREEKEQRILVALREGKTTIKLLGLPDP